MDQRSETIMLYSQQAGPVLEAIKRDGVCFSKADYVRTKYGESAPVFLTAYQWFVDRAPKYVSKPSGAEFPYWAFRDLYSVDAAESVPPLILEVPKEHAIFFDMYDWNKIMQFQYIGETQEEEKSFKKELSLRGLKEFDIMLNNFYPEWKKKIYESWSRLFRHHEKILMGDLTGVGSVQAGLWQIRKEWIV